MCNPNRFEPGFDMSKSEPCQLLQGEEIISLLYAKGTFDYIYKNDKIQYTMNINIWTFIFKFFIRFGWILESEERREDTIVYHWRNIETLNINS